MEKSSYTKREGPQTTQLERNWSSNNLIFNSKFLQTIKNSLFPIKPLSFKENLVQLQIWSNNMNIWKRNDSKKLIRVAFVYYLTAAVRRDAFGGGPARKCLFSKPLRCITPKRNSKRKGQQNNSLGCVGRISTIIGMGTSRPLADTRLCIMKTYNIVDNIKSC